MIKICALCLSFLASLKAFAGPACPVCMVTVGASLYLAEKSGLDKCVIGVWSGALLAIFGYFLIRYFNKKNWNFKGRDFSLMALSVGSIGFLYLGDLPYEPVIIGCLYIDSFLLSNILGALVFIVGINFYAWMKEKNGGHAHFPFEKVVVPVLFTGILSTVFYFYPLCDCAVKLPTLNKQIPEISVLED
ncbi:MAG: hypothetical protein J6V53_01040 [Alphaproteobacteria bacterium]|nr:hypothetical protein [Alphaproteobacteria bacterium]